jgi:hypothetical protein
MPVFLALATLTASAAPVLSAPDGPVPVRAGNAAQLNYAVSWDKTTPLAVLAPELPDIAWGTASVTQTGAVTAGDTSTVELTVSVTATEPGNYEWPALRVPYVALEGEAAPGPLNTTTVQRLDAAAVPLRFAAPWRWSLIWSVAALALGAAAAAVAAPWWRGRVQASRASQADVGEAASALLHEARRHRLDGDFYAYYKALTRAAALTGAAKLAARLEERTQSAGYRGIRPIDDDMDGDLRAVEQTLAGRREENPA